MFKNKTFNTLALYYSSIFMAGSIVTAYISIYFSEINFSYSQIGLLNSMGAFISIISQPIWGSLSDKSENKNDILKIILIGAVLTVFITPLAKENFILAMVGVIAFNFFHKAMSPINDTIVMDLSRKYNFKFSTIRLIGSLGYAIMTAIGGKIVAVKSVYMFYICFFFMLLSFLISFKIPTVKGHKKSKDMKKFSELFKDRKLVKIYFYVFILSSTNAFFQSFHGVYSKEIGIPLELLGIGIMLGSLSQFPIMFIFDKAHKKFGIINLMTLSGLVYGFRWIFYGTLLSSKNILLIWLIHGFNYMLLYLCLVDYVQTFVPKELHTRGQVMNTLTLFGYSSVIGSYLGGQMAKKIGMGKVFIICGIICLISAIIFNILENKNYKKYRL